MTHLRGTECRGWVEYDCYSHILSISGLHTEEQEDQWLPVAEQPAKCLPLPKMGPAARTELGRAGSIKELQRLGGSGGMVLCRRACSSCFSSAELETEMQVSDHRQKGVPARAQFGARISPLLSPGGG